MNWIKKIGVVYGVILCLALVEFLLMNENGAFPFFSIPFIIINAPFLLFLTGFIGRDLSFYGSMLPIILVVGDGIVFLVISLIVMLIKKINGKFKKQEEVLT